MDDQDQAAVLAQRTYRSDLNELGIDDDRIDLLASQWIDEVYRRAEEVDPDNEHDWESMCLGWTIAKGLPIEASYPFFMFMFSQGKA